MFPEGGLWRECGEEVDGAGPRSLGGEEATSKDCEPPKTTPAAKRAKARSMEDSDGVDKVNVRCPEMITGREDGWGGTSVPGARMV